jgi:hypothetical protein
VQQLPSPTNNTTVTSKNKKNKITLKKINSNEGGLNGNLVSSDSLPKNAN